MKYIASQARSLICDNKYMLSGNNSFPISAHTLNTLKNNSGFQHFNR